MVYVIQFCWQLASRTEPVPSWSCSIASSSIWNLAQLNLVLKAVFCVESLWIKAENIIQPWNLESDRSQSKSHYAAQVDPLCGFLSICLGLHSTVRTTLQAYWYQTFTTGRVLCVWCPYVCVCVSDVVCLIYTHKSFNLSKLWRFDVRFGS